MTKSTSTWSGFTAGTLVHTRQGLKPIESIAVGDLVLSQSLSKGARDYKPVARARQEAAAICRLYYWIKRDGQILAQEALTTPFQQVYVAGYHNNGAFSDEYWEQDIEKPIGWRPVDFLESHQLIEVAGSEPMHSSTVERIWMTREAGKGWIEANRDSNIGHYVQVGGGAAVGNVGDSAAADLTGVETFNLRNESPILQEKWGYRCPVYALEVEGFHTYYVGEHGIWVHDGSPVAP